MLLARLLALVLCAGILLSLVQGGLALTEGRVEGLFPDRLFYVIRSPGPPRPNDLVTYFTTPATGEWWLTINQLSGSAVSVQIYDLRTAPATLIVASDLRAVGQESGHVRLERDVAYQVVLTPQGRPGTSVLAERFRYETNTPPVPCFTFYPSPATQNYGVNFDAGCSTDEERDIVAYAWDFGDGRTGSGRTVSVAYRSFGVFTVTLRVIDTMGNEARISRDVTVYAERSVFAPPHEDFGLDEDGNGRFDVLVVRVHLAIGTRDPYVDIYGPYYRVTGQVDLGETVLWDSEVRALSPGFPTIDLRFEGLGFRVSGLPGPYLVNLSLEYTPTNTNLDEGSHATLAYGIEAFEERPAAFEAPHLDTGNDTDGDGKFDVLVLELGIRVGRTAVYDVTAGLWDSTRTIYIGGATVRTSLEPGRRTVALTIPGWQVNTSRVNGPYRIDANLSTGLFNLDSTTTYTQPYEHDAFNGPPASFFGAHDDRGIDADGDGLYEFLEVGLSVVATRSVTATIYASLYGIAEGSTTWHIETIFAYPNLVEGVQRVPVRFGGLTINESHIDGPYVVELELFATGGNDHETYATRAYSFREFLGPVATLPGDLTDYGLDTDGDGRFNFLVVEVPVQVNIPFVVQVFGYIDDINIGDSNVTALPVGLHRVALRFDGVALRTTHLDRAVSMRFWVYDNSTREELAMGTYLTGHYSYEEFEETPAVFAPPHSDYGRDTDGDGLFNFLVLEVHLQVYVPDTYSLSARLDLGWPTFRTLNAYNESELTEGAATLRISFDGVYFRLLGRNQTLSVSMTLWSASHPRIFTTDFHSTRLYNYSEFEEIPFVLAPPYTDYGLDTDEDGLFNELVLEVGVTALTDGVVFVNAQLYSSRGTFFASGGGAVAEGPAIVTVRFDGWRLRDLGADGPYFVDLVLYGGEYGELARDRHTTGTHRAADFDPALALDPARTTDRGEDSDGDGSFDFLVLDVAIEVELGGTYRVEASIRLDSGRYVSAYADTSFQEAGRGTLTLRFNGMALWGIGVDGPYVVNLTARRFFSHTALSQYTTGAYLATSFDMPPAIFVPPFSETAVDTDGDGLFNAIRVDATVEVREAGNYSMFACLDVVPNYCRASNGTSQRLDAGTHTIRFDLPGARIRWIGIDGPYTVTLQLRPMPEGTMSPEWTVYASFETATYRYEEFDYGVTFGTIQDRGVDTSGNGRYEWLQVSVELEFEVPDWFTLEAYLEIEPYSVFRRFDGFSFVGSYVINFSFEAWYFNASGRDGPYTVRLVLSPATGTPISLTYLTAAYRVTDFEG